MKIDKSELVQALGLIMIIIGATAIGYVAIQGIIIAGVTASQATLPSYNNQSDIQPIGLDVVTVGIYFIAGIIEGIVWNLLALVLGAIWIILGILVFYFSPMPQDAKKIEGIR